MAEKLLIELNDFTMLRGHERRQEVYFVFLGYDVEGAGKQGLAEEDNPDLDVFVPEDATLKNYFYMGTSPIFRVRKQRTHVFPGGYPIYYDAPSDIVSFYMAVVESDKGAREVFSQLFASEGEARSLVNMAIDLLSASQPTVAAVKQAFQLTVKAIELTVLKDDVRYTNVLSFKKHEGYLAGVHDDWGNQRVSFSIESVPPE